MFYVQSWKDDTVIFKSYFLRDAKRVCRDQGHDSVSHNGYQYAPMAWVADEDGMLVYNPRFPVPQDEKS